MNGSDLTGQVVSRLRNARAIRAVVVVCTILVGVLAQSSPAQAAFGPNLIVNGSFEVPSTPTGTASAPFGTCGATVPMSGGIDGLTLFTASSLGSSREGCWTLLGTGLGTTPTYVDRILAKGGLQSVHVQSQSQNIAALSQAVVADAGTYRLQFKATQEMPSFAPMTVLVWSLAGGAVNQTSAIKFAPTTNLVNGILPQTWTSYKVDIIAPVGTDHLVVCLCTLDVNGVFLSARMDAVTLKKQL